MKTLTVEVKTFYTVEISFTEWWKIFNAGDEDTAEAARKRFADFPIFCTGTHMTTLATALGFDGWQNAGYINKRNNSYVCVLYNRGDTL